MRGFNVLKMFLIVLIAGVIFAVQPVLSCNSKTCQNDCIAIGATSGICQVERNGQVKCMCSYDPISPPACDVDTCRSDCIANSEATGGICQIERTGEVKCMCSYN